METKVVINDARDEIRLGDLTLRYDQGNAQLEVGRRSHIDDAEVFALGDGMTPELWESFVKDLENKIASGPMLSALQQVRELAKDARWRKVREENGELDSGEFEPGVKAYAQMGLRAEGIVRQVLEEFERTSPAKEDERHVSILDGSTAPRGIAPEEVMAALNYEAELFRAQVTVLNWNVTEVGDDRIVHVVYSFVGSALADESQERVRAAIHVNDRSISSVEVGE